MTTLSVPGSLPVTSKNTRAAWRVAGAALAIGVATWTLVFWPEIAAAIRVWIDSTAFNHCFLVLPVAAYIAWQRRAAIASALPEPEPGLALLGLPVALAWLFAERVGIMEGRQLLAMILLQIMFASVLGRQTWGICSAPLLYLFFLVPFGEFLTPLLQTFTANFIRMGLNVLGILNFTDGMTIQIPEGTFFVAEACAGLRFLIASIAFGVLYACIVYQSVLRRVIFIGLSIIVPILANGIRALAIVAVAHWFGSDNAVTTDHIFYGWLLFSIVTFVLILIGLPFRDAPRDGVVETTVPKIGNIGKAAWVALAIVILCAGSPRVLASYLDRHSDTAPGSIIGQLPALPDCNLSALSAAPAGMTPTPYPQRAVVQAYQCGADYFVVSLEPFPARIGARTVFSSSTDQTAQAGWQLAETRTLSVNSDGARQSWFEVEFVSKTQREILASAVWVDGQPASGIRGRIRQALNIFRPSNTPTIVARVKYVSSSPADASRASMDRFLAHTGSLSSLISGEITHK